MNGANPDTKKPARQKSAGKRAGRILAILLILLLLLTAALLAGSHFAALHYAHCGDYELTQKYIFSQALTERIDPELAAFGEACRSLSSGNYEDACSRFSALSGYRSADQLLLETKYLQAREYLSSGDLLKAQQQFQKLDTYKDSQDWLLETQLQLCRKNIESGDYLAAYRHMQKLAEQKDLTEELSSLRDDLYRQAVDLYRQGAYTEALIRFRSLGDYRDTGKFLLLASARTEFHFFTDLSAAEKIYELRDFEDGADVLLCRNMLRIFLQGSWKDEDDIFYFTSKGNGDYNSNLYYLDYGRF